MKKWQKFWENREKWRFLATLVVKILSYYLSIKNKNKLFFILN